MTVNMYYLCHPLLFQCTCIFAGQYSRRNCINPTLCPKKPQQLSCEASFVFLIAWLFLIKEDRMFSNDYVKRFCRNTRKFSYCRAFSFLRPLPAAGHIATAPDNSVAYSAADVLWVQYRAVCHKVDLVPRYYLWVSYMQNRLVILTIYTLPMKQTTYPA